jgi:hypothetical protein
VLRVREEKNMRAKALACRQNAGATGGGRGGWRIGILDVDRFFRGGDNKKVLGVLDWFASSDLLEV